MCFFIYLRWSSKEGVEDRGVTTWVDKDDRVRGGREDWVTFGQERTVDEPKMGSGIGERDGEVSGEDRRTLCKVHGGRIVGLGRR